MTITTKASRTFECDGWDCHAIATQSAESEAELQARGFPEGWSVRVNRDRMPILVEHLCPECTSLNPCPEGCVLCFNEACNLCGAGCWNSGRTACDHDVVERHEDPDYRFIGLPLEHPAWQAHGGAPTR